MIKNERQYRITRAQAQNFELALDSLEKSKAEVLEIDPILKAAEKDAMRSQLDELRGQLQEYEALRAGKQSVVEVNSLDELPRILIQARIASGLSQRELAARLRLKEQQIQRYEATDYRSASIKRISEVVRALGIKVRPSVQLENVSSEEGAILRQLRNIGFDDEFINHRLIGLSSEFEDQETEQDAPGHALLLGGALQRIFGWDLANIVKGDAIEPDLAIVGAGRFKIPAKADRKLVAAYSMYAYYLARQVAKASSHIPIRPIEEIPQDPIKLREAILAVYGSISFEHVLSYIWDLGIPVLPLADKAAFHGACWRFSGRNVIVLKQKTRSMARWLHDLLHELCHGTEDAEAAEHVSLDLEDPLSRPQNDPSEQWANEFSAVVVLGGKAEELALECCRAAKGNMEWLKRVVPEVAAKHNVPVDSLANHLAYRLSQQGESWWGPATNLQQSDREPWAVARDILIQRVKLDVLGYEERGTLMRAMK